MSEPTEDKVLEEYLHRKSAISMGYRRVYLGEAPSPELDKAITARARRALRYLIPGVLAVAIGCTIVIGIQLGVHKWMRAMVAAEANIAKIREEEKAEAERERLKKPIPVVIDAENIAKQEAIDQAEQARVDAAVRAAWLEKIDALTKEGKTDEARDERNKMELYFSMPRQ